VIGAVTAALGAAALFGASTPLAKQLLGDADPALIAGLLYLGAGAGLTPARLIRDRGWSATGIAGGGWLWLAAAVLVGGMLAPLLLMLGLARTSAGAASLLLNFEVVLTVSLAWLAFGERADRRTAIGVALIVAGGVILSWPDEAAGVGDGVGPLLIGAACLCWGLDNNLTKRVAHADALFIAAVRGLVAGAANVALALAFGAAMPAAATVAQAMAVGFLGYGVSLVLFVLALRGLGAARTGAYFGTAPFLGAAVAIIGFGESATLGFAAAAAVMALGVRFVFAAARAPARA
jgi:drug/metabolite transporter (DMT)-like permease